jgi:DNA-binding MarR family transcriptional regulator
MRDIMAEEKRIELARRIVNDLPKFGLWATGIRDFETPYGKLGFRQLAILWALRYKLVPDDDLSPGTLAQQQNVRPSVITRALARLEDGGFIERAIDLADRRRIKLALTSKGRDVSIYVEELYLREIMDAVGPRTEHEIDELLDAVARLDEIADRLQSSAFGNGYTLPGDESGH